jgi:hypothetical protein
MSLPKVVLKPRRPRPNPEPVSKPADTATAPLEAVLPELLYMVAESTFTVSEMEGYGYDQHSTLKEQSAQQSRFRSGWITAMQQLATELGYSWEEIMKIGMEATSEQREALFQRIGRRLRLERDEQVEGLKALFG